MSHGPRWRADILDLLSLAWPVVINRLGVMMLGVLFTLSVLLPDRTRGLPVLRIATR